MSFAVILILAVPITTASKVYADSYDDQIKALQNDISTYQKQASELKSKATTLENELNSLARDKTVIQAQIDLSQAKYDNLEQQINDTKRKIETKKTNLGNMIANKYVDDSISPLEMLASSKNIADYIDKSSYQSSITEQLNETIKTIDKLKMSLELQSISAKRVLTDSQNSKILLLSKENERQTLLDQTNGQEAAYQQQSKDKQLKSEKLREEQIAANQRAAQQSNSQTIVSGVVGGGGYPAQWANSPIDSLVDSWSLYNRECVSYVAWKLSSVGKFVPMFAGQGNANQWESYVKRYNIASGSEPVAGSAAVLYVGTYGHVMYVESVNSDKSRITVSEYNYGWTGLYSKRTISSANLRYIYF